MKRIFLFIISLAAGLGLTAALTFAATQWLRPPALHGLVMQPQQPAYNFTLMSHYGQTVSLSDFRGKWVMIYFGYIACPDVCPATLAELNKALLLLGKQSEKVQVVMITVDPERDTKEQLAGFMPHFNKSFIGLTGTSEQIKEAATYYGIYFAKHQEDTALGYLVDHTATVMLIDPDGYLRVVYSFGTVAKDFADDLKYLMAR
ncbi:MAG: SCO family protein [Chloroflexi bacterium]|nr:SCO family protein [Chloroflexota bacterium]